MIYSLKNESLTLEISSKGAEILSIQDEKGIDYLWNGNEAYWGRRAPILFPFIGRLKNSVYRYKGVTYKSEPHGFARNAEFQLVRQSDTEMVLEMRDSDETYRIYPFHFSLQIGYRLNGRSIRVSWKVTNLDEKEPMYFSIGAHPGFLCPFNGQGTDKEGYFLELLGGGDSLSYHFADYDTGLLFKETRELPLVDGKIRITRDFFDESTYLFLDRQVKEVSLLTPENQKYVSVKFDMPILAVWSPEKLNAPFICLEPWCGCCDGEWFEGNLEEREWGNCLQAKEVFDNSYEIILH